MLKRRVAPIVLVAALLGGAAVRETMTDAMPADAAKPESAMLRGEVVGTRAVLSAAAPEERLTPAAWQRHTEVATLSLSADAAALLAQQVELQLMASGAEVHLSPAQWSAFASVTAHHQAIRQAYEASIAMPVHAAATVRRLEIPAYPAAGDTLRAKFFAEPGEKLGPAAAGHVAAKMGPALEGYFAGFGVAVQTLDFTRDRNGNDADYQVTRTVKFWNSVEANNRLTTRRETHFPGLEDPSGHTWGPFLAVLAAQTAGKSGS